MKASPAVFGEKPERAENLRGDRIVGRANTSVCGHGLLPGLKPCRRGGQLWCLELRFLARKRLLTARGNEVSMRHFGLVVGKTPEKVNPDVAVG